MSKKRTPWFSHKLNPVRDGPYERYGGGYSCWKHGRWGIDASSPEMAITTERRYGASSYQGRRWRGLAENPSKKP